MKIEGDCGTPLSAQSASAWACLDARLGLSVLRTSSESGSRVPVIKQQFPGELQGAQVLRAVSFPIIAIGRCCVKMQRL